VRLVSISIDPEVDTPARLREYAARVGATGNWVFLTGSADAVEAAQRAFGAYRGSKEAHAAATYVRRTATAPWERIDGLASVDALLRASTGDRAHDDRH
jgi:protein SCO1/2